MHRGMQQGVIRKGNPILVAQSLVGPVLMHWVTRPLLQRAGMPLPSRSEVSEEFARAFARAHFEGVVR